MGDSDEAPPSPLSPGQFQARPSWPRLFTPDWITAAFTVVLALSTLTLVITSYFQHRDAVDAIQVTKQTASAELILKLDNRLAESRYDKITEDLQSHDSNYHLPKYKKRTDADVEEYIGIFEDIGNFVKDSVVGAKMAYDHFSYDIEKAWCNTTVQDTIRKARATDKSKTAQSEPLYGSFEGLAKEYLAQEGQTCKDMDNQ